MPAKRNIKLCTKDCLCLYVCPTGATDTEDGQIDASKCLSGCRVCVDACPSNAISYIPDQYPPQQEKTNDVKNALYALSQSKSKQEKIAASIAANTEDTTLNKFANAISISNRIMTEDVLREAGFMLPQSESVQNLLQSLIDDNRLEGFPKENVDRLLSLLENNNNMEENMKDSKTLNNLMDAFAGESQANRKYTAYAKKAEKDGKINAAKLFRAASDAETIHALKHFEVAGKIGETPANLEDAVAGETHEYKDMYPDFIKEAEAEGNKAAVRTFNFAMKAEEVHARLYQEALDNLDSDEEVFYYLCPVCGNIEKVLPEKCSICGVPGSKFIKY